MNLTQIRYEINNHADYFPEAETLDWDCVARDFNALLSQQFTHECPEIIFDGVNTCLDRTIAISLIYAERNEFNDDHNCLEMEHIQIINDLWAEYDVYEDHQN